MFAVEEPEPPFSRCTPVPPWRYTRRGRELEDRQSHPRPGADLGFPKAGEVETAKEAKYNMKENTVMLDF